MKNNHRSEFHHREGRWLRWLTVGTVLMGWALWQRWQRYLEKQAYPSPVREQQISPDAVREEKQSKMPAQEHHAPQTDTLAPPDDLTQIEGIGPKVHALLQEAGLSTFAQLAKSDVETLRTILRNANLPFMNPETWPEQASLAAAGEEEKLASLQEELKGGQRS